MSYRKTDEINTAAGGSVRDALVMRAMDRPWSDYPIGTKVHAVNGGFWEKTERGWKWCTGATFPTPAGDWIKIELPA